MSTGPNLPVGLGRWAVWLIVVLAVLAVLYVAASSFGVPVPSWLISIVWICVVACVLVAAVRFLTGLRP